MKLISINVGRPRLVMSHGEPVSTGIYKDPVEGRVMLRRLNLDGDRQADLTVHGGPTKAVYAYPSEHYEFWQTVRAQAGVAAWDTPLGPGALGENLTVAG